MKLLFRSLIVFLCLIFTLSCIPVYAISDGKGDADGVLERFLKMMQTEGIILQVESQKELQDFCGNSYRVYSFVDGGYMIYHVGSGQITEYSVTSPSPYSECKGDNLFYAGPTYFYYLEDGIYHHTITSEMIDKEDSNAIGEVKSISRALNNANMEKALGSTSDVNATNSNYMIYQGASLANLNTAKKIGYWENDGEGVCGFIAAGLLLYWHDQFTGPGSIINDFSFISTYNDGFIGPNLTRYLVSLGTGNGTSADGTLADTSMFDVLTQYKSNRYLTGGITYGFIPTFASVRSMLNSNQVPIILFMNLSSLTNPFYHAVLAYGYQSNDLVVHYGWAGYSNVVISSGAIGSYLYVVTFSEATVPVQDVPSNHWSYLAVNYCLRYGLMDYGYVYDNSFFPNDNAKRCEFVNALYQLAGAPEVTAESRQALINQFSDVTSSTSYLDALAWAYSKAIIAGTSSTTLSPNGNLKRQQAAVMLYAYSNCISCNFDETSGPSAATFNDYSSIAPWAVTAMSWATKRYLIVGSGGYLYPTHNLTRAETAQLIKTFANKAARNN